MTKNYLTIFKEDCCGCHACEVACKQEHRLGVGPRLIRIIESSPSFVPVYCRHCADAPCAKACPVQAIERNAEGVVLVSAETCIGCRDCVVACPFGAMQFDGENGIALKCDLCREKVNKGEATACSLICPTQCIVWGDEKVIAEKAIAGAQER